MIYLLHSSKTMRKVGFSNVTLTVPKYIAKAKELAKYLKTLDENDIARTMKISSDLAKKTNTLINSWSSAPSKQTPAIDAFLGDIYSGLRAHDLSDSDRNFAQKHLRIISGLYGLLKPLDGIAPYRLEMGYRLPDKKYKNLYSFWGDLLAKPLGRESIINLSSEEYTKSILPPLRADGSEIVTPRFLTVDNKTKQPKFVVVHAKIARGACAHWLIKNRAQTFDDLRNFDDIGYKYDKKLSTPSAPVFVAKDFRGLGLSVRLS